MNKNKDEQTDSYILQKYDISSTHVPLQLNQVT